MNQLEQFREQCAQIAENLYFPTPLIAEDIARRIRALPLPDAKALNQRISTLEAENELLQTQIHCAESLSCRGILGSSDHSEDVRAMVMEALQIGLELAQQEATNVHAAYRGYMTHKHEAADKDVAVIQSAIALLRPEKEA